MSVTSTPVSHASSDVGQKSKIAGANATLLFILAYLTADGLYRLATIGVAAALGIPGVWHFSAIRFRLADAEWWRTAVVAVYGAGPLACLALAGGAAWWFWQRARFKRGLFKQYLLWLTLHGLNLFFGALVADTFTQNGFWYVPSWLFLAGNIVNVALAFIFGLVLPVLGYLAAPLFLQSHDSRTLMRYEHRRRLLLTTLLAPWLLGSVILCLAKYPDLSVNERLHLSTLLLALLPLALACSNELFEFTIEAPQKTRLAWGLAVLMALLLGAGRVVLGHGLTFG
ncbi:hypothetical protein [Hymenobacter sp. CRA2]|uniref:hypothetical protein n=1 Tax=Hymenobacter sp. CRA2 TaxID=1955620 RepID=UPI00098E8DF8|nr:hypothetical protein [Hymenobacter sp. CRA2]OON70001.1 hypothetical protein B0919_04445 [Hymenobacter sp. CRA2]